MMSRLLGGGAAVLWMLALPALAAEAVPPLARDPALAPFAQTFSQIIGNSCKNGFQTDPLKLSRLEQQLGHAVGEQATASYCDCAADKAIQALTADDLSDVVAAAMSVDKNSPQRDANTFQALSPEIKRKIIKASFQCLDRLTNGS